MPVAVQAVLLWSRPLDFLQACRRRYGDIFTLRAIGHPPLVFVSDPEAIRAVLTADEQILRPDDGAAAVGPIVGERSFMLQGGAAHRNLHKALRAALGSAAVQRYAAMVEAAADRAVATWPVDTAVDLHWRLHALTLEVILRMITGQMCEPLDSKLRLLHERVLAMLAVTRSPVLTEPYLRHGPGRRMWQTFLEDRAVVDELLFDLIDEQATPSDSLLRMLTSIGNPDGSSMSTRQIRDNVMSVILAGHETTATQLAWAFQLLAHHPSVQRRLADEIDVDQSDAYMHATVHEILRHRCVFPFPIPRTLATAVDVAGHRCDPPAQLLPCIHLVHHDAAFHAKPQAFTPERHLERPLSSREWLPWGGGRRRCPGLHLADLELKVVLRAVLSKRIVLPAGAKLERPRWRGVIVAPHAGCRVILRAR